MKCGIALLLVGLALVLRAQAEGDLDGMKAHLRAAALRRPLSEASVLHLETSLGKDGSWPDIDYEDRGRSGWTTARHLRRIRAMATAYRAPGHRLAGNDALHEAIIRALGYWLDHDFQNPNWWHNRINVPQETAEILLLMAPDVPPAMFDKAVNTVVTRGDIDMTGQNRVWLAGITLRRAILIGDAELARKARDAIVGEIHVTTSEGVQPDASFHQHGPQQQFGNYGLAFAHDGLAWQRVFADTPYAMTAAEAKVLQDYLLDGMSWVLWRGKLDVSACGRQLGPDSPARKGRSVMACLRQLAELSPGCVERCKAILTEQEAGKPVALVGLKHFWRSDYTVYRQPGFYASVKMSSRRVTGTETCNSENLLGARLADGAMYVYRDGAEYDDILPVWNWRRIPGITAVQDKQGLVPDGKTQNRQGFVGGVSDGQCGVSAMDFVRGPAASPQGVVLRRRRDRLPGRRHRLRRGQDGPDEHQPVPLPRTGRRLHRSRPADRGGRPDDRRACMGQPRRHCLCLPGGRPGPAVRRAANRQLAGDRPQAAGRCGDARRLRTVRGSWDRSVGRCLRLPGAPRRRAGRRGVGPGSGEGGDSGQPPGGAGRAVRQGRRGAGGVLRSRRGRPRRGPAASRRRALPGAAADRRGGVAADRRGPDPGPGVRDRLRDGALRRPGHPGRCHRRHDRHHDRSSARRPGGIKCRRPTPGSPPEPGPASRRVS